MNLYDEILNEFERRNILHVRDIVPFFISSFATHNFNLVNQNKQILIYAGKPVDTRQHILFVAPPGGGKTFFLEQFLDSPAYSLLPGTDVQSKFMSGNMTEASFIGQIEKNPQTGDVVKKYGFAHKFANAILGCEEFSAVTRSFTQQYNAGLDTSMLTALDSGRVAKDRGPGSLEYKTSLTVWAGTQPARYDLGSGFARRFIFVVFIPTWSDIQGMINSIWGAIDNPINQPKLAEIRKLINKRAFEIQNYVNKIIYDISFKSYMVKSYIMPYEQLLYQKMAIGYWLAKSEQLNGPLTVYMDDELKRIIQLERRYRKQAKRGISIEHVKLLLKTMDAELMELDELLNILSDFSIDEESARAMLSSLAIQGLVSMQGAMIKIHREKFKT